MTFMEEDEQELTPETAVPPTTEAEVKTRRPFSWESISVLLLLVGFLAELIVSQTERIDELERRLRKE